MEEDGCWDALSVLLLRFNAPAFLQIIASRRRCDRLLLVMKCVVVQTGALGEQQTSVVVV